MTPWWWAEGEADGIDRYDGPHATRAAAIESALEEVDLGEVFTIMKADLPDDGGDLANVTEHEELTA
ncbi:MAG: hypothetical protein WDM94_09240 [Bauldia sp.]